jgi:hypothetical protein
MSSFYVGIEPAGNPGESTTISVTEFTLDPILLYKVRYLQRFPEGAPYPMIIETVNQIREELRGGLVVLNSTFIGDPVRDMFKTGGISPVSIYVANVKAAIKPHIENAVDPLRRYDHLFWEVPYLDIVSVLQVAFQKGQLQIAPDMDLAQSLIDEIMTFRLDVSPSGKIEKLRIDQNADLLLSVAISVYTAARFGGNPIPIENLTTENVGTPEILDDDARRMPKIWDSQEQSNNQQRPRLKYAWAQPSQQSPSNNNLPGLM